MKSNILKNISFLSSLLLLAGAISVQAATTYTEAAAGNWSASGSWTPAGPANGAGNIALGAGAYTMTLDQPYTIGWVENTQGSSHAMTVNASGTVAITMDNTGGGNTANGDANACISSSSSGAIAFSPNIIIQNTDLEIEQSGSTSPSGTVGILGTSTITATSARNLILIVNEQKAGQKVLTINSSIGATGGFITVSNIGLGTGPAALAGVVGPNASVVQNSIAGTLGTPSTLQLNNGANNYTGPTIITNGTLQLGAANAIPSVSTVTIYGAASGGTGTLNLNGHNDTIDGLNGNGTITGATTGSPTVTLTVGGNNSGGNFGGVIGTSSGTLGLTKTGSGTQILSGANTYSGATTLNGGILNAGIADTGSSGPFGNGGQIVFGGGMLQYSTNNGYDYSGRFSSASGQLIRIDLAGTNVTFASSLNSSGGSLTVTDSVGGATLTLTAGESYSGNTTINGGTLALSGSGALANNSSIQIGAGGTLNVASLSSYTLGTSATLGASGAGTTVGTTAATIVNGSGNTFYLGSQPLSLTWNGASSGTDSTHPSLYVSQGTLEFGGGNTITVVVPGTALGVGVYTLISAPSIIGAPSATPSYGGNGIVLGKVGVISVSGGNVILTVSQSPSVVGTWTDGGGSDHNWNYSPNWSGGVPQLAGSSAIFGTVVSPVTLNANESVGTLLFTNAGNYTISGGDTLTLDNSGAGALVEVDAGTNTVQTPVSLNDSSDNTVITVQSNSSLSLSGNVSSTSTSETIAINSAGTTILSGNNSYGPSAGYTGTTFSGGGTLQLGNNSALGAGDLSVTANGTLEAGAAGLNVANNIIIGTGLALTANNNGYNLTLDGVISGTASLTAIGNGILTLNGNNTYAGNTTVNAGVLSISSPNNLENSPTIILNGGGLMGNGTFTEINNIGIGPVPGSVGATAFIDASNSQTFTVSGVIATAGNSGVNNLTINSIASNPGEVVLSGVNTFNGTTVISNGTLDVANSQALQFSTLNYSSGTLAFDSSITAATFAGLTGTNNLILTNLSGSPVTLTVGGNNANINYGSISDAGQGGSLTLNGTGTMSLTNANYTGNTTLDSYGTLTILGGSIGSASSTITLGNGNGGPTLNISGTAMATANQVNNGIPGGSTGCSINIIGSASAAFNNVQLGGGGDTSGPLTINTTGSVSLGNLIDYKDIQAAGPSTTSGLIIDNGTVTATSIIIQDTTSGADMNINGGSLTIGNSSSSGAFEIGNGNSPRGGWLTMTNGTLTYLGTDGLLMMLNSGSAGAAAISGGTVTLTGITLDYAQVTGATNTLTVSGGTLYIGSVGIVDPDPSPIPNAILLGPGTVGAIANWESSAPMTLTNTATFQAADASGNAWNIELDGVLTGNGNLVKIGNGILLLTNAETYTGETAINAGTLNMTGSLASTNIIVGGGATFNVTGLPSSTLILASGQTLTGGGPAAGNVNGSLNIGSGNFAVNYTNGTSALNISGALTVNSNTVTVSVLGTPLGVGTYTLANYNTSGSSGSFNTTPIITGAKLAAGTAGVITNGGGKVQLIVSQSINPNPPVILYSLNGTSLTLSWPTNLGWELLTNSVGLTATNNWFPMTGSTNVTNEVITINPAQGNVFFEMRNPD
jgi:autotransporter-associated beta strand protein